MPRVRGPDAEQLREAKDMAKFLRKSDPSLSKDDGYSQAVEALKSKWAKDLEDDDVKPLTSLVSKRPIPKKSAIPQSYVLVFMHSSLMSLRVLTDHRRWFIDRFLVCVASHFIIQHE